MLMPGEILVDSHPDPAIIARMCLETNRESHNTVSTSWDTPRRHDAGLSGRLFGIRRWRLRTNHPTDLLKPSWNS